MNVVPRQQFVDRARKIKHPEDWVGLNVLLLEFGSLSHQAYCRNLPRTVKYLEEEMSSVILNGYNIIRDSTSQAFIPMLTAKTEEESPLARKRYPNEMWVSVELVSNYFIVCFRNFFVPT